MASFNPFTMIAERRRRRESEEVRRLAELQRHIASQQAILDAAAQRAANQAAATRQANLAAQMQPVERPIRSATVTAMGIGGAAGLYDAYRAQLFGALSATRGDLMDAIGAFDTPVLSPARAASPRSVEAVPLSELTAELSHGDRERVRLFVE